MTDTEQRNAATKFYNDWRGIGDEKSDSQRFWIDFLRMCWELKMFCKRLILKNVSW